MQHWEHPRADAAANPRRRTPRTATQLAPSVGRKLDATLEASGGAARAGFVFTKENPADGRRQLYVLNPAVQVSKSDADWNWTSAAA